MNNLYQLKVRELARWCKEEILHEFKLAPKNFCGFSKEEQKWVIQEYIEGLTLFGHKLLVYSDKSPNYNIIQKSFYLLEFMWYKCLFKLDKKRIYMALQRDTVWRTIKMIPHIMMMKVGC